MTEIYDKYIFELPIIPKVVSEVLNIPKDSSISSQELEKIIKMDPHLTVRILKSANSAYYSREREICSIKDAVTLIGLKKIKTICLLIVGSEILTNPNTEFYKKYWEESLYTAFISKSIAENSGKSLISEDIFTVSILHNIGQAILYNYSSEKYDKVIEKNYNFKRNIKDLEFEEFGINNCDVASGILQSWNFPELHIDTIKNILDPNTHSKFQSIIDITSLSKLICQQHTDNITIPDFKSLLITFQSRLNLRKSELDFYFERFIIELKDDNYFQSCLEIVSI